MLKIFLSLILLSGCDGFVPEESKIDPSFIPYITEYKMDKYKYIKNSNMKKISIIFFSLSKVNGLCRITTYRYKSPIRIIYINPEYWYKNNILARKILLYHELGHCDLDLLHSNNYTIMYPYLFDTYTFSLDPEYYLNELFINGR